MLKNKQAPEKPLIRTDGLLEIHSIWDTIQGEGPFAGTPATFIRMAGCNICCRFCDTEYTKRQLLSVQQICDQIETFLIPRRLVVFTGGEPFRQDFGQLAYELCKAGKKVQVETNGTLYYNPQRRYIYGKGDITIVCSPKTQSLNVRMWSIIDALKYVVRAKHVDPNDGLPLSSVGPQYGKPARPPKHWNGEIFVQPLDERNEKKNKLNLQAAVDSCTNFGYRLSIQSHKVAGLA